MIILASGSPRRAKILESIGVEFRILKTDAPETSFPADPERTVRENAAAKRDAALAELAADEFTSVIAADTIVWFNDKIYGKPRDAKEAAEFLQELSGNTHTVFTGLAFAIANGEKYTRVVRSDVTFRPLSDTMIAEYIKRVNPLDRAGAYDIDESGDLIVESYTGSYENIMGLPVEPVKELLEKCSCR